MTQARKCDVCRARKVKCDEERPICRPCRTSGRPCTFKVADSIRFVKQLPIPSEEGNGVVGERALGEFSNGLALRTTRRPSQGSGVFHTFSNASKTKREKQATPGIAYLPDHEVHGYLQPMDVGIPAFNFSVSHREQLKMLFLDTEFPPGTFLRRYLVTMYGDWFEPRGKAMQLALDCVLLLSLKKRSEVSVPPTESETRRLYGTAMKQLRMEIEAPNASQDDGVLGAIEALTLVEQFQDKPSGPLSACSWLTHFRGLERCFEVRGPSTLDSSYARNLLFNAAPTMLINAVEMRFPHFLGRQEWQDALAAYSDNPMVGLIVRASRLPDILVKLNGLAHIQWPVEMVELATMTMNEADRLNHALQDWWHTHGNLPRPQNEQRVEDQFPDFFSQFNHLPRPLFPFISPHYFDRALDAIHHVWYCICRLLTEQAMLNIVTLLLSRSTSTTATFLDAPRTLMKRIRSLTDNCNNLADSICRSIPYLHSYESQVPYTIAAICNSLMYANRWYDKYDEHRLKAEWCKSVRIKVEKVDNEMLGRSPHVRRHFSGWTLLIPTQRA